MHGNSVTTSSKLNNTKDTYVWQRHSLFFQSCKQSLKSENYSNYDWVKQQQAIKRTNRDYGAATGRTARVKQQREIEIDYGAAGEKQQEIGKSHRDCGAEGETTCFTKGVSERIQEETESLANRRRAPGAAKRRESTPTATPGWITWRQKRMQA